MHYVTGFLKLSFKFNFFVPLVGFGWSLPPEIKSFKEVLFWKICHLKPRLSAVCKLNGGEFVFINIYKPQVLNI